MSFLLTSLTSSKLTKKQIKEICKLKNQQWRYRLQSHINYFKENIKRDDIHNLFYINTKLIGYTLLRERTFNLNKVSKSSKYLLFDTLIIDKKYRGKKLSHLIMNFNNTTIKQVKYFSFLMCKKELINFYKKFGWVKLQRNNIDFKDFEFSSYGMIYNQRNHGNKKYHFYVNR
jgi:predicted GNAT family N-acyltransferase